MPTPILSGSKKRDMDTKTYTSDLARVGIVLSALAMSVGWGFRGDYGHEAGAMAGMNEKNYFLLLVLELRSCRNIRFNI